MDEIWKSAIGFEGIFEVSNLGRAKRLNKYTENTQYKRTGILQSKIIKKIPNTSLSRIIYASFNSDFNINGDTIISYKDKNTDNKRLDNLYETTMKELKKGRRIICTTNNKVFNSIEEASKYYNRSRLCIDRVIGKKGRTAGKLADGTKLAWEYLD